VASALSVPRTSLAVLLAVFALYLQPEFMRTLADQIWACALARQLNLIDRLAEHAANTAPQERARYHFDYARLRADLNRVRAGLQDYLVPQRAQPRDPVPLAGDYVRRDRADDEEPSP